MKKTKEEPPVISSDESNDDVYHDQLENKTKIEQKRNNKSLAVPKSLLRSLGLILLMIIPLINEQFQTLLHLHSTSTDSSGNYNYPLKILLGSSSSRSSSSSSRSLSTYGSVNPGADDDVVMRSSTTTKGSSSSSSRNSGNYYNYLNDISSKNKNNRHHKTNRNSHSKSNRNSKGNASPVLVRTNSSTIFTPTVRANRTRTRTTNRIYSKQDQKNQKQTQTQKRQYKIVGFSDYNFKDVAMKWYARLEDLGYQEHVIIAYDNEVAEFLEEIYNEYNNSNSNRNVTDNDGNANGVAVAVAAVKTNDDDSNFNNPSGNCKKQQQQQQQRYYRYERYILPQLPKRIMKARTQRRLRKGREMMFAMRWHYILEQLQNGISILLTDVDNLFHKYIKIFDDDDSENDNDNISSPNNDFYKYDVIHAYEGKSPIEIYEQIGFTVNGGMNWLQSTPYTIKFVQLLVDTCGIMCDDQIVLNHMIASKDVLDVKWDIDDGDGRQQQQQPAEILTTNEHNNGFDGLVTMSRTGRSLVTNHTIKIWDRDTVFRGEANNIHDCPSREKNWISMPFVDPKSKPNMSYNRRSANAFKLALYDLWDTNCGGSSSNHT